MIDVDFGSVNISEPMYLNAFSVNNICKYSYNYPIVEAWKRHNSHNNLRI